MAVQEPLDEQSGRQRRAQRQAVSPSQRADTPRQQSPLTQRHSKHIPRRTFLLGRIQQTDTPHGEERSPGSRRSLPFSSPRRTTDKRTWWAGAQIHSPAPGSWVPQWPHHSWRVPSFRHVRGDIRCMARNDSSCPEETIRPHSWRRESRRGSHTGRLVRASIGAPSRGRESQASRGSSRAPLCGRNWWYETVSSGGRDGVHAAATARARLPGHPQRYQLLEVPWLCGCQPWSSAPAMEFVGSELED